MNSESLYRGREQTYLKHFFLDHYLERVAYNIYSFMDEFVYVDGFSGPWKSQDEKLADTSFSIALEKLRSIRDGLWQSKGREVRFRCIFVEKDEVAFAQLNEYARQAQDADIRVHHGEFESLVPKIVEEIGKSFSLTFVDPTGWTGLALRHIRPILARAPGEVLVNFMYDFISRFIGSTQPGHRESFQELFDCPPPPQGFPVGAHRERAVVRFYAERLAVAGNFAHRTSTRIMYPARDRTYFHLVYVTRHPKGLIEFRNVERQMAAKQEALRIAVKEEEMFGQYG